MKTTLLMKLLGLVALAAGAIFTAWTHAEHTRADAIKSRQNAFTVGDTATQVQSIKDR
jgi:hypothetical protein